MMDSQRFAELEKKVEKIAAELRRRAEADDAANGVVKQEPTSSSRTNQKEENEDA